MPDIHKIKMVKDKTRDETERFRGLKESKLFTLVQSNCNNFF